MDIRELEAALQAARARLDELLRQPDPEIDWAELDAREGACLEAERALALAKGEEAALACPWEAPWNSGAPLPHVVATHGKAFLIYLLKEVAPGREGKRVRVVDPAGEDALNLALVEFLGCYAVKFGGASDDVIHGHPLYGKGLQPYGAHLVANSRWLAVEQQIDVARHERRPEAWSGYRHYLLLFDEELFECIAKGHQVENVHGSFEQAVRIATHRLFR
jgi:hypothetical protein